MSDSVIDQIKGTAAYKKLVNRVIENPYIPHEPFQKQIEFLLAPEGEVLFGGAKGGGKSDVGLMGALMNVQIEGYSALILRKTFKQLDQSSKGLINRSKKWLNDKDCSWNEKKKRWTFPNGAMLKFGHLDTSDDKYNYDGSEYQYIFFDELTQFREQDYLHLFSCLRKEKDMPVQLKMRSSTNPTNSGFQWVRSRFPVDKETPNVDERDGNYIRYIPSTVRDNPYVDTEEYIQQLKHLSPQKQKKLIEGDWSDFNEAELFDKDDVIIEDEAPGDFEWTVRYWDFASTEPNPSNRDPDWCAGAKVGKTPNGEIWILDVRRCREGPAGVEKFIKQVAREDGRRVPIVIELEPGGQAKHAFEYYATQVLDGYDVHKNPVGSASKGDRAKPLSSQWRQGNVYIKRGNWNYAFLNEMESFTADGTHASHDDQVDAVCGAYDWSYTQNECSGTFIFR